MSDFRQNPWAGLSSYQDPQDAKAMGHEPLLFCGRDDESYDVAQLIDDNIFVTLYGKSGTGKTSLLNAGVFPRLRNEQYVPVSIRLGIEAIGMSFQECIEKKLQKVFEDNGTISTIDVVPLPSDDQSVEYLWSLFARTRFADAESHALFPVLVFDQFEEVFRHRRKDAEALLCQIHFMMDENHALEDRVINDQTYSYDFNFRFVVAIREDDLYRLEDSIDNNYLVDMKRCRFRLRNLSEEGARMVICTPGEGLLQPDERDKIAMTIIEMARNHEDNSISVNILSLICSRIFVEYQRTGARNISISLVDKFVKGNPFERFYNEATRGFSNREKSYIETNLVDSDGRRNSIPESDFLRHVKNGSVLFEGNNKILQRVSTSSDGGIYRVELIHDSFCEPLAGLKEKREKFKRLKWFGTAIAISLLSIAVVFFMTYLYVRQQESETQLQESEITKISQQEELEKKQEELEKQREEKRILDKKIKIAESAKADADLMLKQAENATADAKHQLREAESAKADAEAEIMRLKAETAKIKDEKDHEIENISNVSVQSLDGLTYLVDGITFSTDHPTLNHLSEWKGQFAPICKEKIVGKTDDYRIPTSMIEDDPCLVYLVITSKSIRTGEEKQSWFDLYSLMNQEQRDRLYDILYRESYKLAHIEKRYEDKQAQIRKKYAETTNASGQGLSADELNSYAYEAARHENWGLALDAINKAIELSPSEANYYDSKGEILFDKGEEEEAVKMWKKVLEIDPNFLDKYNGSTGLYEKLKKRKLISDSQP